MSGKSPDETLNAVRTVWNAGAIDTSHLGFRPIQKIATIHASSGFIRGIPVGCPTRDSDWPSRQKLLRSRLRC
jgi:hypothetical protein